MAGRLAIDFGTSNTRAALWDEAEGRAQPLFVPDVSETTRYEQSSEGVEVPFVPSLIHFDGNSVWIGKQVKEQGLSHSNATFRWMKRYISNRLELPRRVNGRTISFSEAGAEFLTRVVHYAASALGVGSGLNEEEVAFTVPVESYEHYQNWLTTVCEKAGITRYRLLDEASAAALGYGVNIQGNDVYMVFDFGGGTLDVSVVRIDSEATGGKRCRVLGKAGADLGGTVVDQWIFQDVLARSRKEPEDVRHLSGVLLLEVERAKEALSFQESASIAVTDPHTGAILAADYTRSSFEELLEKNGFFHILHRTVEYALAQARERGYERDHIKAVLLVGGSTLIPCVRRVMRMLFGERVHFHRPLDAVSLGAAAFVGGVDFYDHIQHSYALRYYNREKGDFDYRVIVEAGTPYPTTEPLCRLTVKASHDDQEFLGLNIFEVGRSEAAGCGGGLDLVYDSSGAARFQQREHPEIASLFWVNEKCPTFIRAQPKAKKGDPRFPAEFTINANKFLCVTVRDNTTGKVLLKDHPVVKLT